MMKTTFLSLLSILIVFTSLAQQPREIWLKSSDKGFYLEHKIVAKENFYSVGRLYNVPPKDIAAYNKIDMNKGLNVDQVVRIPLTPSNFSQTADEGAPVYYKVKEKEGLMKVSGAANNVPLVNLRRWNALRTDDIKPGSKMIIGFLISSQLPSVTIVDTRDLVAPYEVPEPPKPKKDSVIEKPGKEVINTKPVAKTESPIKETPKTEIKTTGGIEGGYFKSSFEQQSKSASANKSETVTSGIFKTTSGWQDAKYYLLIDAVQPGTIVKVVNPTNNKAVYAKVLGEMTGIRQNEGLNIRISNAAAAALQVTEQDKFVVKLNW